MRRRRARWPYAFLVILALVGWWRWRRSPATETTEAPATPIPQPPHADAAVHASSPRSIDAAIVDSPTPLDADLVTAEPRPTYDSRYSLLHVSTDGTHALVVTGPAYRVPLELRLVAIDTGTVEADVVLEAVDAARDKAEPAVLDELRRARDIVRGFPLGNGGWIAATPDGASGAFDWATDDLVMVRAGVLGAKVPQPAAYEPLMMPDGQTVMFRGYDGRLGDQGKYAMFTAPLATAKPAKIAGTDGANDRWAVGKAGDVVRVVVSHPPQIAPCVLEISVVKPFKVTAKRCLGSDDDQLSPAGDWAAWLVHDDASPVARIHTIEMATGKLGIEAELKQPGSYLISDTGRLVIQEDAGNGATTFEQDAVTGARRQIDFPTAPYRCGFRGASELVCERDGSVEVTDLAKLPDHAK